MRRGAALLLLVLGAVVPRAHAASIALGASKDNTLYAEFDTLSNGAGTRMFAGRNSPGNVRRGLVAFDLTLTVPAGAVIDSVVLQLYLAQTGAGTRTVALHRLAADWGEGSSVASGGEGGGASATAGDATWTQRFFGAAQPWAAAGGDFDPAPAASRPVGAVGFYAWRSAALTSDVAFWIANPSLNYGWEVIGDEGVPATAKAFSTRQAAEAAQRPMLTIYYTEAPTPAGSLPGATRLFPARPNPFNPITTIRFHVAARTHVRLDVLDARGRRVRTLVDAVTPAGPHEVTWRGEDALGTRVASGVYFVRLSGPNLAAQIQKLVLVK